MEVKHTPEMENNILIADFMGLSTAIVHGELCYADWDGMHEVKYHTSWEWLMPVVEKIRKHNSKLPLLYCKFNISMSIDDYFKERGRCHIIGYCDVWMGNGFERKKCELISKGSDISLIDATYQAILEFIKWYNQSLITKATK